MVYCGLLIRSCTRARGPPVASHLSCNTCRSRFPLNPRVILGFFKCSNSIALHPPPPPKTPYRTCRPSTVRGVARQAAEKVSRYRGVWQATLAGVGATLCSYALIVEDPHPTRRYPDLRRPGDSQRESGRFAENLYFHRV